MKFSNNCHLFLSLLFIILLAGCSSNVSHITPAPEVTQHDKISNPEIQKVKHIIHISVDGLYAPAITTLGQNKLPGFYFIRSNGSFTDNARTDDKITVTLPSHTSQFTGRPVLGSQGHGWRINKKQSKKNISIHSNKGQYVSSIFDIVHDAGLSTALYTGKSKFSIFSKSWGPRYGAIDKLSPDNGRNKIDNYVYHKDTDQLVERFIQDLATNKYNYAFLHLRDPDSAGHARTWSLDSNSFYLRAIEKVDTKISAILNFIEKNKDFKNATVLIITSDHGGQLGTKRHTLSRKKMRLDSDVIPFYVYGVNVPAAADLYSWNPSDTFDPGNTHPFYTDPLQPIRNGDVANFCMELLGLQNIPDSSIDNLSLPLH